MIKQQPCQPEALFGYTLVVTVSTLLPVMSEIFQSPTNDKHVHKRLSTENELSARALKSTQCTTEPVAERFANSPITSVATSEPDEHRARTS